MSLKINQDIIFSRIKDGFLHINNLFIFNTLIEALQKENNIDLSVAPVFKPESTLIDL